MQYCENNGRRAKGNAEIGKQVLRLPGVTKMRQAVGDRKYEYHGIGLRSGALRQPFSLGSSFQRPIVRTTAQRQLTPEGDLQPGGTLPSRSSKIRPRKTGHLGRRLSLENTGFLINPS